MRIQPLAPKKSVLSLMPRRLAVAAKLPADGSAVPDGFYLTLTCSLLSGGLAADEIAALPPAELLDRAVEGLTIDRSRADALLAILQAMKQAQVVRPELPVVK